MRPPKGIVMKRRLHNKLNTNSKSGFTLVELIVTLAVAAIVASIGGMGISCPFTKMTVSFPNVHNLQAA